MIEESMPKNDKMVRLSSVLTLLTILFKDDRRFLKALKTLKPQEEQVLRMRFGIGEKSDHTLEAVGQDFEVTRDNIRRIEKKALRNVWKRVFLGGTSDRPYI